MSARPPTPMVRTEKCLHCHRRMPVSQVIALRRGAFKCADRVGCAAAADYPVNAADFPTREQEREDEERRDIKEASPYGWRFR